MDTTLPVTKPKSRRGFASMSPELQRAIASKGGKAAHAAGTAHEFNAEEAAAARAKNKRVHQWTPETARLAGKKGGLARAANRLARQQAQQTTQPTTPNA